MTLLVFSPVQLKRDENIKRWLFYTVLVKELANFDKVRSFLLSSHLCSCRMTSVPTSKIFISLMFLSMTSVPTSKIFTFNLCYRYSFQ
jgi:hypothetical protein